MQYYLIAIGKFCPYVEKSVRGILQFLGSGSCIVRVNSSIGYGHSSIQVKLGIEQNFILKPIIRISF